MLYNFYKYFCVKQTQIHFTTLKMKAVIWTKYGKPEVMRVENVQKPVLKDNEVLIRVHGATVTNGDCELRAFRIPLPLIFWLPLRLILGVWKPKKNVTLGQEFSGEVVELGKSVKEFNVGDKVFGGTGIKFGAYSEFRRHPISYPMTSMPSNMSYEEAATLNTGGINGLHFLRLAEVTSGEKVLINGAGGSIGTYAVQLAKDLGATVTAVDHSSKLEMLSSIGADHVIDYTKEDFTENGEKYDAIVDVAGGISYFKTLRSLKPNGRLFMGNPILRHMFMAPWTSRFTNKKVRWQFAGDNTKDLVHLRELVEAGRLRAVIDKRFSLDEIVEAHKYVETGQKAGNVVISV